MKIILHANENNQDCFINPDLWGDCTSETTYAQNEKYHFKVGIYNKNRIFIYKDFQKNIEIIISNKNSKYQIFKQLFKDVDVDIPHEMNEILIEYFKVNPNEIFNLFSKNQDHEQYNKGFQDGLNHAKKAMINQIEKI